MQNGEDSHRHPVPVMDAIRARPVLRTDAPPDSGYGNERVLSAASTWEIAIKYSLGKLELPEPPSQFIPSRMALTLTSSMAVEIAHTFLVSRLPFHHRDLFDRLLTAQAQLEKLPLLTADDVFEKYDVEIIRP